MRELKVPLKMLQTFSRDNWQDLVIMYDFDDILHPFVGQIVQQLGLDIELITDYDFERCLSPDLAKRALEIAYSNRLYDSIQFFPGVEDILRPQLEFGIHVEIRTNSTSDFVGKTKFEQLRAKVPDLRESNFHSTVVSHEDHQLKTFDKHTIISVDDCPKMVASSPAPLNVTVRWPWNTTKEAALMMADKQVRWRSTLDEVNNEVYNVVRSCLATVNRKRMSSQRKIVTM